MTGLPLQMLEAMVQLAEVDEECPYLRDRTATLRFGSGLVAAQMYRHLMDAGYRRSGCFVYRPVCRSCHACKVLRVPVASFRMSKGQRRVWNRGNRIFRISIEKPSYTTEKQALYRRYLDYQHGGAREPLGEEQYRSFLVESSLRGNTFEIQLSAQGRLVGVGVLDRIIDAVSTVYFYFDPEYARYSPGTYSALYEIDLARRWGLAFYYMGFYIETCPSMSYKAHYRPYEIKTPDAAYWRRCEAVPADRMRRMLEGVHRGSAPPEAGHKPSTIDCIAPSQR